MRTHARKSRGLFAWGWPTGSIDQLLCASAHADDAVAAQAWRDWAGKTNLETDVSYREMRLLATLAPRLSRLDPNHAERNRVLGIERSLWSRTHILLREMSPSLDKLRQAKIEMMVLKGAARVARDRNAQKHRFVADVDLLVHPTDFRPAFDVLAAEGWKSTSPGTEHFHRTQLDSVHGMNLIRGHIADLDLHRSAFHHPHESLDEDQQMWMRSASGMLANCPVRVPSPTDTVVIALAHGAEMGHRTSDWLLDAVDALSADGLDWKLLEETIKRRRLVIPSAIVLTYLAERLRLPIPEPFLQRVVAVAKKSRLDLLTGLVLSRPKNDKNVPLLAVRWAAKKWWRRGRERPPSTRHSEGTVVKAKARWIAVEDKSPTFISTTTVPLPDRQPGSDWHGIIEGTISVPVPNVRRQIEFELRTGNRHIARIRYRRWIARRGIIAISFRVAVNLNAGDGPLILESASARGIRPHSKADQLDRYGSLPFQVVKMTAQTTSATQSPGGPVAKCA